VGVPLMIFWMDSPQCLKNKLLISWIKWSRKSLKKFYEANYQHKVNLSQAIDKLLKTNIKISHSFIESLLKEKP